MSADARVGPLQLDADAHGGDRLRRLLDGAQEAYLTLFRGEVEPRAEWASDAVMSLLGMEPAELGQPGALLAHVHPGDHDLLEAAIASDTPTATTYRWRYGGRLDQPWRTLEITILPVEGADDVADARIRSLDDTELLRHRTEAALQREAQAARELEHLQQLRQHVLRSLTHRVRTPLAILRASAETALDPPGPLNDQQVHDLFGRIHRATSTLQDLLTDLLELPNMERVVDLDGPVTLVEEIVDMAIGRALRDGHPVRVDAEEIHVNRHLTALRRCLVHLLDNVERHTPAGTKVHVLARTAGDHVLLQVSDDGPGLPERVQSRLFEPFVSGEGEAPDPRLGIGLTVVHHLAEGMGGTVEVDSAPDEGVTVTLSMPHASLLDAAAL